MLSQILFFLREKKWLITFIVIILAISFREYIIFKQIDLSIKQTLGYANFKEDYYHINSNLQLFEYTIDNSNWQDEINTQNKSKYYFNRITYYSAGIENQITLFSNNFIDLGETPEIIKNILAIESSLRISLYENRPQTDKIQKKLKFLIQTFGQLKLEIKNLDIQLKNKTEKKSTIRFLLTLLFSISSIIIMLLIYRSFDIQKNQIFELVKRNIQKFREGEKIELSTINKSNHEAKLLLLMQQNLLDFQKILISLIQELINHNFEKIESDFPFNREKYLGEKIGQLTENFKNSWSENINKDKRTSDLLKYRSELSKLERLMRENSENPNLYMLILKEIIHFLKLNQGGFFTRNTEDGLFLSASYAYNSERLIKKKLAFKEGLIGTCAYEQNLIILDQIPQNYIEINSGLGEKTPTNLILLPIVFEKETLAVIELASFTQLSKENISFLKDFSTSLALFLNSILNKYSSMEKQIEFSEHYFVNPIDKILLTRLNNDLTELIKDNLRIAIFNHSLELINYSSTFQSIIPFKLSTFETNFAEIVRIDEKEINLYGKEINIKEKIIANYDNQANNKFFIHKIILNKDEINFVLLVF